MPAERSLLSSTTQGSKPSTPRRLPFRTSGSSSSLPPSGSASSVGAVISGISVPMRTFMPARRRMFLSTATFCR